MQILRLLAARRASTAIIAAPSKRRDTGGDDEGPFFDLDFTSSCSVRASSPSGSSGSDYDSDESCDFIISLQRTRSGSLLFSGSGAPPLKFCASEPPARANNSSHPQQHGARKRGIGTLRTMSFGARGAKPLYGAGRHSFARSSFSSTGSLRLSLDSSPPDATDDDDEQHAAEQTCRRAPARNVIRRCLAKISRRLRTAASPRADARGLPSLRKCRSAASAARGGDDSAVEKQDGIASAIAHCKDSLHRASTSESGSPSDPGKCEAA